MMTITIHRGQNQIGGSIIEISSKTTRIILDAGSELDEDVLEAVFALKPVLFVHDNDAGVLCGDENCSLEEAAEKLFALSGNDVVILRSEGGSCFSDGSRRMIAPGNQKTDAGTYAAAYIAARTAGVDQRNSLMFAGEQTGNDDDEQMKNRLTHMITYTKRD